MARNNYPAAIDLVEFLRAADITLDNALIGTFGAAVNAAKAEFERDADRVMLAGSASLRRFDPPVTLDGLIHLPYDLASISSITYQPTGGTSTTFDAGEEYDALPFNASSVGKPYRSIKIYNHRWVIPLSVTNRNSIRITGRWGYATTVPDDAWLAIVAKAAWNVSGITGMVATGGGIDSWSDGDRSVKYGDRLNNLRDIWAGKDGDGGIYGRAVNLYRRWDI